MARNEWLIETLATVVERFQFHCKEAKADNSIISDLAEKMCEIELDEMWMLTQG